MKTVEEVDIETREIMEAEAAIEVQEDIALMMKITMMKIITKKTMMMIMTKKMKAETAWEEVVVEVQVAVPAEGLAP